MARSYARAYPALLSPDAAMSSQPTLARSSSPSAPWIRWKITETARRTIFLVNIINFYINYDHKDRQQSLYYEPFGDDLILNMPLPCGEGAWAAEDEPSWQASMQTELSPIVPHLARDMNTGEVPTPEITLKTIFSKYTRDYIHREFIRHVGFDDSDQLRSLIIFCALEQFKHF